MAISRSNEYRERLAALKNSVGEQTKELAAPIALDVASGLVGWWLGRQMGRASLLVGFLTYAGGKYHSLHETINREEQMAGSYDEENRMLMSGYHPLYKDENRVYHGDSPLSALGFGMMFGGAFSQTSAVNGTNGQELSATDKAKAAFDEIKDDLKYRLYLDKIFKDEKQTENKAADNGGVSGVSEVDVFIAGDKLTKGMDLSKLDEFDKHVEESAIAFDEKQVAPKGQPATPKKDAVADPKEDESDLLGEISSTRIL